MPTIPNLPEVQSGDLITADLQNAQSEAIGIINAALEAHAGPGGHPLATQQADGLMAAADKTKLDGVATGATKTPLGTAMATALGTAAAGTATTAARSDHVHPMPTAAQVGAAPASHGHAISEVTGLQTALNGKASTTHTHTAADVGAAPASHTHTAADVGAAPASHTHTPAEAGAAPASHVGATGTAHGAATTASAGFMSATDKSKLDGIATGATKTPLTSTAGAALASTGAAGTSTDAARADHVHPYPTAAQVGAAAASHSHTTAQVTGLDTALGAKAPLASPALTGTPTAPTAAANTNTTQIATTAYVQAELTDRAPLASPALTGTPTAPTAATATNSTQIATTAYVKGQGYATLASPTFTGTVGIPTLNLTNALAQSKTHAQVDTDTSTSSIHHTLGPGPTQAAPGNHTHDGYAPPSGNSLNQLRNGLPSVTISSFRSPYSGLAPYWEFWSTNAWGAGVAGAGGMKALQFLLNGMPAQFPQDLKTVRTEFTLATGTAGGKTFTLQWEELMDAMTAGEARVLIEWFNSSDTSLGTATLRTTTTANKAPGWAYRWASAVAPANTTKFQIILRAVGVGLGASPGYLGYRRLKLEEGSSPSPFSTERDDQETNADVFQLWQEDYPGGRDMFSRKAAQIISELNYQLSVRSPMWSGVGFGLKDSGEGYFGFGLTTPGDIIGTNRVFAGAYTNIGIAGDLISRRANGSGTVYLGRDGTYVHYNSTSGAMEVTNTGGNMNFYSPQSMSFNAPWGFFITGHTNPGGDLAYDLGGWGRCWRGVYYQSLYQASDERVKQDIKDSELGLAFIEKLKPKKYRYKQHLQDGEFHGLMAQEVKAALEESGVTASPAIAYDAEADRYSLDYTKLIPPLIKAVQELSEEVRKLKRRAAMPSEPAN
jgi:Chaperone of endosialidase/Phage tail repeat like